MIAFLVFALAAASAYAQTLNTTYLGAASLFIEPSTGASNVSDVGSAALTVATVTRGTLSGPLLNATLVTGVISFTATNSSSGINVVQHNQLSWNTSDGNIFTTVGQGIGTSTTNAQILTFTIGGKYAYLSDNLVVCSTPATTQSSNPSVAQCFVIGDLSSGASADTV